MIYATTPLCIHVIAMYNCRINEDQESKKVSTPILILSVLSNGPNHGYAIAREIQRLSADALKVGEGALYPVLRVLERDGLVESTWEIQPSGSSRRIYTLTEAGHAKLAASSRSLQRFSSAVNAVLGEKSGGIPNVQPA